MAITAALNDDASTSAPTDGASIDAADRVRPGRTRPRDGFLDALRAVAIVRVITWHAFGDPIISWVIATMPIMFFVAGSLLIRSLDARPPLDVLRSRLRRLMLPFWMFGAIVLAFLSIVHLLEPSTLTRISPDRVVAWIVPLTDPTASAWEAGWASSPLWYIRAYLWLLLLSPLLVRVWRRVGIAVLPALVLVMMIGQVLGDVASAGPGHVAWLIGDVGIYGFFLVLGFAHTDGAFRDLGRRDLVEWIVVAIAAVVVAWRLFPAGDGVLNHSYPALLAAGVGWLGIALLVRPWLASAPDVPVIGPLLFWMTRRAMSIYLWHSPAIVGTYLLIDHLGAGPSPTLVIAFLVPLVVVAATATGWIEDVAAGRPAEIWPARGGSTSSLADLLPFARVGRIGPIMIGAVTAIVAIATVVPVAAVETASARGGSASTGIALPPAPSGRPDPGAGSTSPDRESDDDALASMPSPSADATLGGVVDDWLSTTGITGASVVVSLPDGTERRADVGTDADGSPIDSDEVRPVTSVTKMMTAAIVMQLVAEGTLDLDAPVREIPGAGPIPGGAAVTIRQLLDHSSGLAPYQEAPTYDAAGALDPITAVRASLGTELQWVPGTRAGYSNSGYLALGLIIEAATGARFEDVLRTRILEPNSLTATHLDTTPSAGWVGASAGGVVSNLPDLATFGRRVYADHSVVDADSLAEMTRIDDDLMSGLGVFPVCPCVPRGDGSVAATSVGHNGGSVTLQYSAGDGVVIAAAFSESFWTGSFEQADVYELLARVRAHVTG